MRSVVRPLPGATAKDAAFAPLPDDATDDDDDEEEEEEEGLWSAAEAFPRSGMMKKLSWAAQVHKVNAMMG